MTGKVVGESRAKVKSGDSRFFSQPTNQEFLKMPQRCICEVFVGVSVGPRYDFVVGGVSCCTPGRRTLPQREGANFDVSPAGVSATDNLSGSLETSAAYAEEVVDLVSFSSITHVFVDLDTGDIRGLLRGQSQTVVFNSAHTFGFFSILQTDVQQPICTGWQSPLLDVTLDTARNRGARALSDGDVVAYSTQRGEGKACDLTFKFSHVSQIPLQIQLFQATFAGTTIIAFYEAGSGLPMPTIYGGVGSKGLGSESDSEEHVCSVLCLGFLDRDAIRVVSHGGFLESTEHWISRVRMPLSSRTDLARMNWYRRLRSSIYLATRGRKIRPG